MQYSRIKKIANCQWLTVPDTSIDHGQRLTQDLPRLSIDESGTLVTGLTYQTIDREKDWTSTTLDRDNGLHPLKTTT